MTESFEAGNDPEDESDKNALPPTQETRAEFDAVCTDIEAVGEISAMSAIKANFDILETGGELIAAVSREDSSSPDGTVDHKRQAFLTYIDALGQQTHQLSLPNSVSHPNHERDVVIDVAVQQAAQREDPRTAAWLITALNTARRPMSDPVAAAQADQLLESGAPEFDRDEFIHYSLLHNQPLPDGTRFMYFREAGKGPYATDPEEAIHAVRLQLPSGMLYRYSRLTDGQELLHIAPEQPSALEFMGQDTFIHDELINAEKQAVPRPDEDSVAVNDGKLRQLAEQMRIVHTQLLLKREE